jgi:TRAP-type transport system periplasmic protein
MQEVSVEMTGYIGATMQQVYENGVANLQRDGGGTINYLSEEDMRRWAANTPNQLDRAAADMDEAGYPGTEIIARYRELAAAYVAGEWPAAN